MINRHLFRPKYDAWQVLAAFAVTVGDETNPESLNEALWQVAEEMIEPERIHIWFEKGVQ